MTDFNELKDVIKRDEVYIHHDQGSQYLSSSFTKILKDDGFIQSVSARGNSQDNAPMESFFGRLKTSILDIVAMTKNYESAEQLVNGYLEDYIETKDRMFKDYEDTQKWKKMMLTNIAKAGFFSSDRTIEEYNRDIWKLK